MRSPPRRPSPAPRRQRATEGQETTTAAAANAQGAALPRRRRRRRPRCELAGRIERVLDPPHQRDVRQRAARSRRCRRRPLRAASSRRARARPSRAPRERRSVVARDVHGADAELRAPARAVARGRRAADVRQRAGRDRDPAAVRRRRAVPARRMACSPPALRVDVGRRRLRAARASCVPSQSIDGRCGTVARRLRRSEPARRLGRGTAAQRQPARARRACRTSRRTAAAGRSR